MPLPRWLARANRRVTNRILGPLAANLPGFGIVVHTGRKTGRTYRTPVLAFRRDSRYTVALTYGAGSDWVQNVLARGGCTLESRGRATRLTTPRVYETPSLSACRALCACRCGSRACRSSWNSKRRAVALDAAGSPASPFLDLARGQLVPASGHQQRVASSELTSALGANGWCFVGCREAV